MSFSLPIDELDPGDETRRDGLGRYLIVPEGGGKLAPYSRVTTVAATLGTEFGITSWKATMTAIGAMLRPGLRARWEALISEHDGDPWYGSQAGKKASKQLVEDCCAVGGASDRAEIGTALHTLTALIDWGKTPNHLSPETEADLTAYVNGLVDAGVTIVPEMIEMTVVLDEYRVAGTFDRLVRVPGFDLPLVGDLKSGRDLQYSWHEIAVQLAIYSRAEAIYVQGADPNGSEDIRTAMPAVDQHHGLVMWLPAGEARLELFLVDLDAGWEAFHQSMWVRGWRNQKVSKPLGAHTPPEAPVESDTASLVPLLQASLDAVAARKSAPPVPDVHAEVRVWLQVRIDAIGAIPAARAELKRLWPDGVATLKRSDAHTPEQLAQIEAVLDRVEARCSVPFGPNRPGTNLQTAVEQATGRILQMFPGSSVVDEPALPQQGE